MVLIQVAKDPVVIVKVGEGIIGHSFCPGLACRPPQGQGHEGRCLGLIVPGPSFVIVEGSCAWLQDCIGSCPNW